MKLSARFRPCVRMQDLKIMDKIHVTVSGNDKISALIDRNAAQITKIVLAEDITEGEAKGFTKEWNINGEQVTLGVERI